jgi:anti-sigma regulatory factor (Ser/Thr protein kinase)
MAAWAAGVGLTPERVEDLALAVGEALSNSIEHAYPSDGPGPIELDGRVVESVVHVEIRDHGVWREPRPHPGWRGRGISMIHLLADDARVETLPDGTIVTMSWSLGL